MLLLLLSIRACQAFVTPPTTRPNGVGSTTSSTQRHFFNFGPKPEEKEPEPEPVAEEYEKDPVEKIFEFFFGKPEAEPLGLKRFGKERFPEQYPATVDEWAEPLEGDSPDVAKLRPLLKNTNVEFRNLKLTYDANKNGWNAAKFHQCVDRLGGALVVCTTQSGQVCGGYNPKVRCVFANVMVVCILYEWWDDIGTLVAQTFSLCVVHHAQASHVVRFLLFCQNAYLHYTTLVYLIHTGMGGLR